MSRQLWSSLALIGLVGTPTFSQQFPPGFVDPAPLLAAVAEEIGEANLRCITYYGTGYNAAVGQTFENAVNIDWPQPDRMANYTRTINWETGTSIETFDREPGLNPAAWKYGPRMGGRHANPDGEAADAHRQRQFRLAPGWRRSARSLSAQSSGLDSTISEKLN